MRERKRVRRVRTEFEQVLADLTGRRSSGKRVIFDVRSWLWEEMSLKTIEISGRFGCPVVVSGRDVVENY